MSITGSISLSCLTSYRNGYSRAMNQTITKRSAWTNLIFSQIFLTIDLIVALFLIPSVGVHLHHLTAGHAQGYTIFFLCILAEITVLRWAFTDYIKIKTFGVVLDLIDGKVGPEKMEKLNKLFGKQLMDSLVKATAPDTKTTNRTPTKKK